MIKIGKFLLKTFNRKAIDFTFNDGGLCIDAGKLNFWGRLAGRLITWNSKIPE